MTTMKTAFILNASVQKKNGRLHLVYSHFDPIKKITKPKWKAMGLVEDEKKAVVEKRKREMMAKLEEEELRLREGYNDPSYYPLLQFLNDWLENSHKRKRRGQPHRFGTDGNYTKLPVPRFCFENIKTHSNLKKLMI